VATLLGWDADTNQLRLSVNGKAIMLQVESPEDRALALIGIDRASLNKVSDLKAPMPGLVRRIVAMPGTHVHAGDPLLVLEAMKMENVIKSPAPVTIAEVCVQEGQAVEKNTVLVRFA
jgi:biotin carboxyl carrier protein